jgi:hypothetical protein
MYPPRASGKRSSITYPAARVLTRFVLDQSGQVADAGRYCCICSRGSGVACVVCPGVAVGRGLFGGWTLFGPVIPPVWVATGWWAG